MFPEESENLRNPQKHDLHSVKARRQSGNLRQKHLHEESMEESQEFVFRDTANFDELNLFIHEGVDSDDDKDVASNIQFKSMNARMSNECPRPNNRYAKNTSLPSTNSHASKPSSSSSAYPKEDLKSSKSQRTFSSRRPYISKEQSRYDQHAKPKNNNSKPIFHKNKKANQMSINLRKGSPIKAEVDLFTTNSNSVESHKNFSSFNKNYDKSDRKKNDHDIENINPGEPTDRIAMHSNNSSKILSEIPQDHIRTINEQIEGANFLSFSSKQNSETKHKEHTDIKKTKYSDLYNMRGIRPSNSSKKWNSNILDNEGERKITPVKNNFFNDFDSFSATGEYFKQGHYAKDKQNVESAKKISNNKGDTNDIEIEVFTKSQTEGKLNTNVNKNADPDAEKQCLLTFSKNEVKVDDEIIEKYCNILNQRTLTSLDDKSKTYKSFVKNLNNTTFTKEANKTMVNNGRQKAKLNNRCMSQSRTTNAIHDRKNNGNKSVGRGGSKRSVVRNKMNTNTSATRNTKNLTTLRTETSNMVTKRVGGGYSSYAYDPNEESKKNHNKEPATQRNQNKYATKVKWIQNTKRKTSEDWTEQDIPESKYAPNRLKMFSPNRNRPNRLIKKKADEDQNLIVPGSFSMFKNKSPTVNKVLHREDWNPCELCRCWQCMDEHFK